LPTDTALLKPPKVPSYSGSSGTTRTNTDALDLFADNIGALNSPVLTARSYIATSDVAPGGFFDAYNFRDAYRNKLVGQFGPMLDDLAQGLNELRAVCYKISANYRKTNDMNNMTAADIQPALDDVNGYFSKMMKTTSGQ
jgi:hypothetical protein